MLKRNEIEITTRKMRRLLLLIDASTFTKTKGNGKKYSIY
jgi:hypothetical protein